jgi:hypothetical protein
MTHWDSFWWGVWGRLAPLGGDIVSSPDPTKVLGPAMFEKVSDRIEAAVDDVFFAVRDEVWERVDR